MSDAQHQRNAKIRANGAARAALVQALHASGRVSLSHQSDATPSKITDAFVGHTRLVESYARACVWANIRCSGLSCGRLAAVAAQTTTYMVGNGIP